MPRRRSGLLLLANCGFPKASERVDPELIRSAVRSAGDILDRALGTVKQLHEHKVQGGIVVAVAGPPQVTQQGDDELRPDSVGNGSNGYLLPPDSRETG